MFGFLKDKLKKAVGKFSKDVEKQATVEKKEVVVEVKDDKKGFFSKIFGKKLEKSEKTVQDGKFGKEIKPEI